MIVMAIPGYAIGAIMAIWLTLAIKVLVNMATNMVNIGVFAKNMTSVDYLRKRNKKICISSKVMGKTKYFIKK